MPVLIFGDFHLIYLLYISNTSTTTNPSKVKLDSRPQTTDKSAELISNQKS